MRQLLLSLLFLTYAFFVSGDNSAVTNEMWIEWDSADGMARLQRSKAKENFWKLVRFYESQSDAGYCSVATSVMALNALSIVPPAESQFLGVYPMFTQEKFFSQSILEVISQEEVRARGMSLIDLSTVLSTLPIKVSNYEAQNLSHDEMRTVLLTALQNQNQCVLALYQRRELGQVGGGHWSPVAAYDAESDSFLILDVARYKYPPIWIKATALFGAMQTSNLHGKSRGFLIIDKQI